MINTFRPLTRRQRAVYEFIAASISENGYAPSLAEIGQHFGLSALATVHKHVEILQTKGYITKRWGHSRAIELVAAPLCPHCGGELVANILAKESAIAKDLR